MNKAEIRTLGYGIGLLLAALELGACAGAGDPVAANPSPAGPAELAVQAAPVRAQEWTIAVPVSGNLRSRSSVEVKTEVGGRLISTAFEEGDRISKGQLIADIDRVNYQLAVNQAQAALEVAEAGIERVKVMIDHAGREKERADNLLRSGGITEKDHQAAATSVREADTQLRLAEAQRNQARAAVSIAEKALQDCRITSPADGRVQQKFFHAGALLTPGSPLCYLVDNTRLELECSVPSYQLSEIRSGQGVTFTTPTWGERRFEGRVHAVNPMIEAESRSVRVIVAIANPKEELRSGMFARGEIEIGREEKALVIPRSAFIAEQTGADAGSAYVIDQGVARRRPVRLADSRKDLLWVRDGLREGDMVVIQIGPALKDGTRVRAVTANTEER